MRSIEFPPRFVASATPLLVVLAAVCVVAGCHDGPMYALKRANPFYSMHQWRADERLGPTDHRRGEELKTLMAGVARMPSEEQSRWMGELDKLMRYDQSPHMRGLAVQAAGHAAVPESLTVIERGLNDDDTKVRMIAARALENRSESKATQLLVEAVNSETNKDVRLAAIKSLGTHRGPSVTDALKLALQEPDLSYRHSSIASLRKITGRDAGNDPDAWIAMLEGETAEDASQESSGSGWRNRLRSLF